MSARARADLSLTATIEAIHRHSNGVYGSPMIHAELADDYAIRVGRKRVARLMRVAGLRGATLRRYVVTTQVDPASERAVDLVDRKFYTDGPDRLWVADITYIPTWTGFLFLAVVLDVFSRRIVGWAMANHLKTELILDALEMALQRRRPQDVIHHSDQGCQYTSIAFGSRCREAGVRPSMSSVGDCFDNAMCESFFATLECELLAKHRFRTQAEAVPVTFEFIEGWYNTHRRHSSIGQIAPLTFERRHAAAHEAEWASISRLTPEPSISRSTWSSGTSRSVWRRAPLQRRSRTKSGSSAVHSRWRTAPVICRTGRTCRVRASTMRARASSPTPK